MKAMNENYRKAVSYIEQLPKFTTKHALEDTRAFLTPLSVEEASLRVFHIAGTNGKGSVASYLESILIEAGEKVGTFVSPHLETIRERIRIDGKDVSEETFWESFLDVKRVCPVLPKENRSLENPACAAHPSYFEFLFLMAMRTFVKEQVTAVILETGLGGKSDVTNLMKKPAACVITSIGMDHEQYLGDTLEKIASEKAGIIKQGCPVIFCADDPVSTSVIAKKAKEIHAPLYPVKEESYPILSENAGELIFSAGLLSGERAAFTLRTYASYQAENAMLAVRTAETAGITDPDVLYTGLYRAYWPARMEEVLPGIFFDGGHNPAGTKALLKAIADLEKTDERVKERSLLFAVSKDKAHRVMARLLAENGGFKRIVLTSFPGERAMDPAELAGEMRPYTELPIEVRKDPFEALAYLEHVRGENDTIFVTGSFYLLGALLHTCRERKEDAC